MNQVIIEFPKDDLKQVEPDLLLSRSYGYLLHFCNSVPKFSSEKKRVRFIGSLLVYLGSYGPYRLPTVEVSCSVEV